MKKPTILAWIALSIIGELAAVSVAVATPGNWSWWRVALAFWPASVVCAGALIVLWKTFPEDGL